MRQSLTISQHPRLPEPQPGSLHADIRPAVTELLRTIDTHLAITERSLEAATARLVPSLQDFHHTIRQHEQSTAVVHRTTAALEALRRHRQQLLTESEQLAAATQTLQNLQFGGAGQAPLLSGLSAALHEYETKRQAKEGDARGQLELIEAAHVEVEQARERAAVSEQAVKDGEGVVKAVEGEVSQMSTKVRTLRGFRDSIMRADGRLPTLEALWTSIVAE